MICRAVCIKLRNIILLHCKVWPDIIDKHKNQKLHPFRLATCQSSQPPHGMAWFGLKRNTQIKSTTNNLGSWTEMAGVNSSNPQAAGGNHLQPYAAMRFAIVGMFLLASVGVGCPTAGSTKAQDPIRIMLLGDSITQGAYYGDGYRYYLWKALVDADIKFDFVGSQSQELRGNPNGATHKGHTFDADHEGHSGWSADDILRGKRGQRKNNLKNWLEEYTPDIVLIHVGTNDVYRRQSHKSTAEEIESMIEILRADNPDVVILLAQLIPSKASGVILPIEGLNKTISELARQIDEPGSPVITVNQYTGFSTEDDAYDGIHPNRKGEEKMAAKWFEVLQPVIGERFPDHISSAQ
jgi:lysophospholipase L1-like esterase